MCGLCVCHVWGVCVVCACILRKHLTERTRREANRGLGDRSGQLVLGGAELAACVVPSGLPWRLTA